MRPSPVTSRRAGAALLAASLSTVAACNWAITTAAPTPAQAEATRLLSLVQPPTGSSLLTQPPSDLTEPAMEPSVDNLVLAGRAWTIPLSFRAAQTWALAAKPGGYPSDNTDFGSSSGPGAQLRLWRVYEAPQDARWFTDQLQLSIAPRDADSTYLRADALVAPMDQQPVPDDAAGKRLRVTVAAPCPADDSGVVGVTNPGAADLDRMLVPSGNPTAGRLCRYGDRAQLLAGMPNEQFNLTADQPLDSAAARRVAAAAAQVSLAHPDGGVFNCPGYQGGETVIALSYPGRPDVDLWQTDDGCAYVANGHIRADFGIPDSAMSPSPSPTS